MGDASATVGLPKLRRFPLSVRLGISGLVLVLLGGLAASAMHILWHYENRDERPGMSLDDLEGAYHGVERIAPILTALENDHPPGVPDGDRKVLLDWLRGDRISEDYDNLDLGDAAPAEVIARNCLDCHSRQATQGDGIGETMPLDYFDDVKSLAFSREIKPMPIKVLAASTHAHALSLGTLALVVAALALMTSWPRRLVHGAVCLTGIGLLLDLGSQWITRMEASFIWVLVLSGALYNGLTAVVLCAVLVDLWLPAKQGDGGAKPKPD